MPELPEVETIKNDLNKKVLNKRIIQVDVRQKKAIRGSLSIFVKTLLGKSFQKINRVGKLLIFKTKESEFYLLIHLKVTGQLIYCYKNGVVAGGHDFPKVEINKLPNKYSHVIFKFADLSQLFFNDMRKFGYLKIVSKKDLEKILAEYGLDPLSSSFKLNNFREIFKNKKTSVKAVLMDQKLIAGIGNIYADEILFQARIKPNRKVNTLKKEEIKNIFEAIKIVFKKAIKYRGTTFSDYVDASGNKGDFIRFLKVYRREGEKCEQCGNIIEKIKIAGRGTRYCNRCQR